MINRYSLIFSLLWILLLAGCGSGIQGASEGDKIQPPLKPVAAAGVWSVENLVSQTDCATNPFLTRGSITVTQDGDVITVRDNHGSFIGGVTDKDMTWSGQFTDPGGKFITLSTRKLAVIGNSFSGEMQWQQRATINDVIECTGSMQFTGAKIANTVPAKPGALKATALSDQSIELVWKDTANDEVGVIVERADREDGKYIQVAKLAANSVNYRNTPLPAESAYFYRVRNYNNAGVSENSDVATATTQSIALDAPAAPQNLKVVLTSDGAKLNWDDKSNNENQFIVSRSLEEATNFVKIGDVDVNQTTFTDMSGVAGTTYYYFVRSANAFDTSDASSTVSITFPAASTTVPAKPTTLSGIALSESSVKLSWKDAASDEDGYIVDQSDDGSVYAIVARLPKNSTGFVDQNLTALKTYLYQVRAFNLNGDSENADAISVQTKAKPTAAPIAPTKLSAIGIASNAIALTWENAAGNNESSFELERSLSEADGFALVAEPVAGSLTHTDQELAPTTTFFYRVRAVNIIGESSYSNTVSATTLETAPNAPSNVMASPLSKTALKLSWQDNANNELNYYVERSTNATSGFKQLAELAPDTTDYSDDNDGLGHPADSHFYYRVRAKNDVGYSAYSEVIEGFTLKNPPVVPEGLAASTVSHTTIKLSWTAYAGDAANILVWRKISGSAVEPVLVATVASTATSYNDARLAENTTYDFYIQAKNNGGVSALSSPAATATTFYAPPAAPTSLSGVATYSDATARATIVLSWQAPVSHIDGFRVYQKMENNTWVVIKVLPSGGLSHTVTGLFGKTTYQFRVAAYNNGGESTPVEGAFDTPPDNTLTVVTGVSGAVAWLGPLTVTSNIGGISCVVGGTGVCAASYKFTTTKITLTATYSAFLATTTISWVGCARQPSANVCEVSLSESKSVEVKVAGTPIKLF